MSPRKVNAMESGIVQQATQYFSSQVLPLQIFYAIGIVAALLLFVQIGLFFLGFDGHHDLDAAALDGDVGFFSLRSAVGFFVGFGWTGVIAFKAGWGVAGSTAAAFGAGLVVMSAIYAVIRLLYRARTSGNIDAKNAVGQTGRVYLSIPAAAASGGQVQVTFQGQLHTMPAITRRDAAISSGSSIVVREIIPPETLVVEPL